MVDDVFLLLKISPVSHRSPRSNRLCLALSRSVPGIGRPRVGRCSVTNSFRFGVAPNVTVATAALTYRRSGASEGMPLICSAGKLVMVIILFPRIKPWVRRSGHHFVVGLPVPSTLTSICPDGMRRDVIAGVWHHRTRLVTRFGVVD